jgi:hypothetical protein
VHQQWSRVTILVTATLLALAGCGTRAQSGPTEGPSRALSTSSPATGRSAVPTTSGKPSPQIATGGSVCSPADIDLNLVSDRSEYRAGEAVTFTATATNASGSPCDLPTGICLPQIQIADSNGTLVWDRAATAVVCPFDQPSALAAGATVVQAVVWDGKHCVGRAPESCPGQPVPGGTYKATANWSGASASTTFIEAM